MKRPDSSLRKNVGIGRGAGVEDGHFPLVKDDQIDRDVADRVSDIVDDDAAELGALPRIETRGSAFDNDLVRKFLERFDFGKLFDAH